MDESELELRDTLARAERIAVLTGAGVSTASGLATFRGTGGLWRSHRAEDLATAEAYARDPELVWAWYYERFRRVAAAAPNPAHTRLAKLEARSLRLNTLGTPHFTLVTQNVDGLHQRAGSQNVVELHGNLTLSRCERCGNLASLALEMTLPPMCPACGSRMRPNVVWFGERLPEVALETATEAFMAAQVALVIGTSSVVEPAASLGRLALQRGVQVIEINPEPTPLSAHATFLQLAAAAGLELLM